MKDNPWFIALVVIFALGVVFPLFWCFLVWLISRLSGWGRLARHHESNRVLEGARHTWQSARIGLVCYNRVLTFTVMDDGLGIAIMPLFSAGHANLLIPWAKLTFLGTKRAFFKNYEVYQTARPGIARLTLPAGIIPHERLRIEDRAAT